MDVLETEEPDNVGGSECECTAGGDKSDEVKTFVCNNDEGGDGKEDNTVGGDGTDVDLVGVYHEHRTPILSVLLDKSTMLPEYCVTFLFFSRKYENCSILPSLHSPCEALKTQISPTCIVLHTIGVLSGVLIWC